MEKLNPWKFGTVLSLAVGLNYVLCTIVWTIWTEPSMDFLNALFHGLDFRKLQTSAAFSLPSFLYALITFMAAVYVLGVIFALLRNLLQPNEKQV
jgi:hypothetical protein